MAQTLSDLALVARESGSLVEARTQFEQALEIRKQHLSDKDTRFAESYSNLASVLSATGQYAAAIMLYDLAVGIYQKNPGGADQHSTTLLNKAMTYRSQSQLDRQSIAAAKPWRSTKRRSVTVPGTLIHHNALTSLYMGQAVDASSQDEVGADAGASQAIQRPGPENLPRSNAGKPAAGGHRDAPQGDDRLPAR